MSAAGDDDLVGEDDVDRRRARRVGRLLRKDVASVLIGALTVVLGVVFVVVDLAYNSGNLIAPIDDAYIHLQYASRLGAGHPFQYNPGDPVSTGASSLLYAFVLAAGYIVGFHGTALLVYAVVLGIACLAVTAALTCRLGTRLVSRTVGVASGVLVALSGPLLWGATSGMEVGLTALLAVATVLSFVREQPRFRLTPVLALLLALIRPEGMLLAVALCVAMVWMVVRSGEVRGGRTFGRAAFSLLPLAGPAAQYLFYWLATGSIRANGVEAKSYLFEQPVFYLGEALDRAVVNLRAAIGLFSGFTNQDFAFPAALLFALGGGAYLLYTRPQRRPVLTAIAVGYALIAMSISTLSTALMHELRYWQPFMPIFILLAVSGMYAATRVIPGPTARRAGLATLLVIAMAFSVAALPTWAVRLGRQAATIRQTDVSAGIWVNRNLPPDAVLAVKDVGAVAYFGDRQVVDMIGLATNGLAKASNHGIGSLYERLRHMPAEQRPDYVVGYDDPPGPSMRPLRSTGILDEPLVAFPVPLDKTNIVPFTQLTIYPADWRLAGSGDRAPVRGQVRDYLNVGSLDAEKAHEYQPRTALVGMQPKTVLDRKRNVIDSGRKILGGERFTVHDLRPGEPLRVVARIKPSGGESSPSLDPSAIALRVNGEQVATWDPEQTGSKWQVHTFVVPASAVTASTLRIELGETDPFLSPHPKYTSYGYWFIQ